MDIRSLLEDLKSTIITISPFLSSLLRKSRILVTNDQTKCPTAASTVDSKIVINEGFFKTLDFPSASWVLLHEMLHSAFRHAIRGLGKNHKLWNICCDGVVNELLHAWIKTPSQIQKYTVKLHELEYSLRRSDVEVSSNFHELSVEEIYDLFLRVKGEGKKLQIEPDLLKESVDGEIIQAGSSDLYEGEEEDREEAWKKAISSAYNAQKSVGNIPLGLQRIVKKLLASKINWKTFLKNAFRIGFGKTITSTYVRVSKRVPDFPGLMRYSVPTIRIGVDTSGSISEEELEAFMSEVYALAGESTVEVTSWDTQTYQPFLARTPTELVNKMREKLRGYGGTEIHSWLKLVSEKLERNDILVVLTDGCIFDIDQEEVKNLMVRLAERASVAIFTYTQTEQKIPKWISIKLEL